MEKEVKSDKTESINIIEDYHSILLSLLFIFYLREI